MWEVAARVLVPRRRRPVQEHERRSGARRRSRYRGPWAWIVDTQPSGLRTWTGLDDAPRKRDTVAPPVTLRAAARCPDDPLELNRRGRLNRLWSQALKISRSVHSERRQSSQSMRAAGRLSFSVAGLHVAR